MVQKKFRLVKNEQQDAQKTTDADQDSISSHASTQQLLLTPAKVEDTTTELTPDEQIEADRFKTLTRKRASHKATVAQIAAKLQNLSDDAKAA